MKQVKALARMITLLVLILPLSACQPAKRNTEELALQIRASLIEASTLDMTVNVTADYGERVYDFTFTYTGNGDGGILIVTAPEAIAGLKAEVSVSNGTLTYDGAVLDTGGITHDGLSPAEALPVLIAQWQSGYISDCRFEKLDTFDTLAVTTKLTESVSQQTWFDVTTQLPIRSELYDGERMVIACCFEDIILE